MSGLKFNANTPLYTSDTKAWRMDEFETVMGHLLALGKPIVIFVHGRGKEPGKSLQGGTFTKEGLQNLSSIRLAGGLSVGDDSGHGPDHARP